VRHVAVGQAADLIVIAPATANSIAKLANGLADDLLGNTVLASEAPIVIAPAMHTEMWRNPATQANIATLRSRGVTIVGPAVGQLTGADAGPGRMEEPEVIVTAALERAAASTRLARAARARGAEVTLIAVNLEVAEPVGCDIRRVSTALELQQTVTDAAKGADVVVMAAAVADYRPAGVSESKIKKDASDSGLTIELVRNPDILAGLGHAPHEGTLLVGFAAETEPDDERLLALGRAKREAKGADLLVVNRVGWNEGFATDENRIVVIGRGGEVVTRAHGTKMSVADEILDVVVSETTTAPAASDTTKEHEPT
jgi:phosphopantothenoylcysteine decarboxylase/phosphopantothenate--cysteine ligase